MNSRCSDSRAERGWALSLTLVLAFAALYPGCASSSKKWKFASWDVRRAVGLKKGEDKPDPEIPNRLVATWTDTVLNTAGKKPTRGFGGRISFFKQASDDPVRVDGQLVVYAFDETSRAPHETQPTRRYIFPAEEFVRHESTSTLGPSYSFWLPWDEVGGQQRNISLITRFEPKEGAIVMGEQTRHLLPGSTLGPAAPPQYASPGHTSAGQAVKLAAYSMQATANAPTLADDAVSGAAAAETSAKKPLDTTTIPLPPRLGAAIQRQEVTSTLDAAGTSKLPLSQLSTLKNERSILAAMPEQAAAAAAAPNVQQPDASLAAAEPVAAPGPLASTAPSPISPTSAVSAPERAPSGHLRDSLLETLPARATPSVRAVPGRAR